MRKKLLTILTVIASLIPCFAHADITSNLLVRYSWDNSDTTYTLSGTILDTSGNAKNATFVVAPPGTASSTTGIFNQAVHFTGINNSQNGGASAPSGSLVIGTGDFSISVWTKAANNAFSRIISTYNSGAANNGYALYWNAGTMTWGVQMAGAAQTITKTLSMDGTTWHHIVATYSQVGRMTIYIDGVATTTTSTGVPTGNITNQNAVPTIGRTFASNPAQDITMDEMCIYARELTLSDVQALYNSGTGATCTAPVVTSSFKSFIVTVGQSFIVNLGQSFASQ